MKMWIKVAGGVLVIVIMGAASGFAFTPSGTKAMGMGGAFTAVVDDLSCVFWNPAGLTQTGYFDLDLSLGAGGENVEDLKNLYELYQALQEEDYNAAENIVEELNAPVGLAPTFSIGLGLFKRVALSAILQADFTIEKLEKGTDEGDGGDEYVEVKDVETALTSLYFSLAYRGTENLTLGLNVKYLQAGRHLSHFKIYSTGEVEEVDEEQGGLSDPAFSFDLGAIYRKKESPLTWGLMIENLLEPKLKFPELSGEQSSMTLSRRINLGVSYRPLPLLTLAADIHNLTDNPTFHLGGELNLKLVKLRAGMNDGDLTLGAGLNLLLLNLEVGYYEKDRKNPHLFLVLFKI